MSEVSDQAAPDLQEQLQTANSQLFAAMQELNNRTDQLVATRAQVMVLNNQLAALRAEHEECKPKTKKE